MGERVTYESKGGVAWIYLDDGKANAINGPLMDELLAALAQAEREPCRAAVLAGRLGFFSGGLDLKTLPALPFDELRRVLLQFGELTSRLVQFPRPLVALSCGHALAGGAVMLLACDWRVGCTGGFKYGLNEVAINLPMPSYICELARCVLDPRFFHRSVGHGEVMTPEQALAAGFLDELVEPGSVVSAAEAAAERLAALPEPAYSVTKRRIRRPIIEAAESTNLSEELSSFLATAGLGKR